MIKYELGYSVEAFTTGRGEVLPYPVLQPHQVHGYRVAVVNDPKTGRGELEGCDALVTNLKECAIGVRTADCVPVLLYDARKEAVAAIHAGWRGTLTRICQKTVVRMQDEYGTSPEDVRAVIGPSICAGCFQVGEEVVKVFKEAGFNPDGIYSWGGGRKEGLVKTGHHMDLVEANRRNLIECGVKEENIQISGICTFENPGLYSVRREAGECGRNITGTLLSRKSGQIVL